MEALTTQQNSQSSETTRQYITINIGSEQYGINIKYVDNIVRMQKITRVPKAQDYFVGVINLRGEILPVMSLRKKFELEDDIYTNNTRIIIVKLEQQGMVGLIVDSVKEVVNLDDSDIEKANLSLAEGGQAYISAVGKIGNGLISLLNLQAVIIEKETV